MDRCLSWTKCGCQPQTVSGTNCAAQSPAKVPKLWSGKFIFQLVVRVQHGKEDHAHSPQALCDVSQGHPCLGFTSLAGFMISTACALFKNDCEGILKK